MRANNIARRFEAFEETLIAVLLGLMTMITFANVIARYVFNANILWALETTVFLFAWLVLIGASYCIKTRTHLGVDVILNIVSPATRKRRRSGVSGATSNSSRRSASSTRN